MPRYNKTRKVINSNEYYRLLRKERGVRAIEHFATPILHNPTVLQRMNLLTSTHIWKYGDRFYKLASQYYGDERFWWVIAWYNGYPTEAHVKTGRPIRIPVNLEEALKALRV